MSAWYTVKIYNPQKDTSTHSSQYQKLIGDTQGLLYRIFGRDAVVGVLQDVLQFGFVGVHRVLQVAAGVLGGGARSLTVVLVDPGARREDTEILYLKTRKVQWEAEMHFVNFMV